MGAPFTNIDIPALLKLDQKENKAIRLSKSDGLAFDTQRRDVARVAARLLMADLAIKEVVCNVVNEPGSAPSEQDWSKLLAIFTDSKSLSVDSASTSV